MEYKDWQKKGNSRHYKYPYKRLYNKMVRSANNKNIEVNINYNDFLKFTKIKNCEYCNNPVKWVKHGKNAICYNLDRKKNNLGYTLDNCIVCCKTCNFLKSDMDESQFLCIIDKIFNNILR